MKKALVAIAALAAGALLLLSAPIAMAHDHGRVNWSVTIGTPAPPVVYGPPPVIYAQPQPVYVQPQPVYAAPAPVVEYGRVYYYYDGYRRPYYDGDHGSRHYRPEWRHRHHRD